jgi:hypothetical protein
LQLGVTYKATQKGRKTISFPFSHGQNLTFAHKMAIINSLSPELLEQIFEYVAAASDKFRYLQLSSTSEIFDTRSTVQPLLLVNKSFYASAQRLHNRHKHLIVRDEDGDGDTQKTLQFMSEVLHDPLKRDALNSIHDLTITCQLYRGRGWMGPGESATGSASEQYMDQMATIISRIPKLRNLTFQGDHPISLSLLRVLEEHHPQCHLHIRDWRRKSADLDHNDVAEIALAHSPNLRTITAELWGDGNTGLDLRKFALRRIVLLSPHLERVDVKEGTFGCFWRSYSAQERARMDELGAHFTTGTPSGNNIKSLTSRGGDHVRMLEDVTGIGELESLDIGCIPNFNFFCPLTGRPRFRNLKHLAVEMGHWYEPRMLHPETYLQDFLAVCSPLESLRITDPRGRVKLSVILDNHGRVLRKLHLHESERKQSDESPDDYCLSLDQIREVRRKCPELREFSVDMERAPDPGQTGEMLKELARFERLEKPTLYFPLDLLHMASALDSRDAPSSLEAQGSVPATCVPADPFNRKHTCSWLENIYSFLLYQRRVNNLPPFKELCVKLGEWERQPPMGLPSSWQCLEGRHKRCFVLKPSARHDATDKIEVRVLALQDLYEDKSVKEERELREAVDWESQSK